MRYISSVLAGLFLISIAQSQTLLILQPPIDAQAPEPTPKPPPMPTPPAPVPPAPAPAPVPPPPPAPSPEQTLLATLTGPDSRPMGKRVLVKAQFIGKDAKFACEPKNDDWFVITMFDGTVAIDFVTETPGQYVFMLACNANNQTALATKTVTITGVVPIPPGPGPVPIPIPPGPISDLATSLRAAYVSEAGKPEDKAKLLALMKAMASDPSPTYTALLADLKASAITYLASDATLRKTRDAITAYMVSKFPKVGSTPTDKTLVNQVFTDIANALGTFN